MVKIYSKESIPAAYVDWARILEQSMGGYERSKNRVVVRVVNVITNPRNYA